MIQHQTPTLDRSWLELPDGTIHLLGERCLIGRLGGCDVVIPVPSLSRRHALLTSAPGGYTLTDLQSVNGTYLNGELLKRPSPLKDGDAIKVGDATLRFRCSRTMGIGNGREDENATRRLEDIRPRDCWLLLADVVGFSALNEKMGSEAALRRLQGWILSMRPALEGNGASINSYVGDAIFAYWPCDASTPGQVLHALEDLEAHRPNSPVHFRYVVHHGTALFTKSEKGEELTGKDVNLVFRAEKITKAFKTLAMLTESAVLTLGVSARCERLGSSGVDGMLGSFEFYMPPRSVPSPDPKGQT